MALEHAVSRGSTGLDVCGERNDSANDGDDLQWRAQYTCSRSCAISTGGMVQLKLLPGNDSGVDRRQRHGVGQVVD